jgi:hypothetical protein
MTAGAIFSRAAAGYDGLMTRLFGPRIQAASPRHWCLFRSIPWDANRIGVISLLRSLGKGSMNLPAKCQSLKIARVSLIRPRAPVPGRRQERTTFCNIERHFVLTG